MMFILNAFLRVLSWIPRKKNIWIFGAWGGQKFADNSRYLFEHVRETQRDIVPIWITRNRDVLIDLNLKGYRCYMSHGPKGVFYRLIGGVFIYTNGMRDFGAVDLSWGGNIVSLWHGMPIKKMQYKANFFTKRSYPLRLMVYFKALLYSYHRRHLTLATSKKAADFLASSYRINVADIFLVAQPREDLFLDDFRRVSFRERLGLSITDRAILFMPTWRDNVHWNNFYTSLIKEILNDVHLNKELFNQNKYLFIKLHPRMILAPSSNASNIQLIHADGMDSQEILAACDELISDYSSALIDFAVTNKTIHIFAPDVEDFMEGNNGLFVHPKEYCEVLLHTSEDLFCMLRESHPVETPSSELLNKTYRNNIVRSSELMACETVVKRIKNLHTSA